MKSKIPAVLILCVLSVVPALAQTAPSNATDVANQPDWFIVGHGTAGSIPLFVAPFKLADSTLFQSQNGYLGLGTVTPVSTFNVVNNETSNNQFGLQPCGIYATLNNSTVNFSAAIRGDSMATTGGGNGVIGLTSWERDVVLVACGLSRGPDMFACQEACYEYGETNRARGITPTHFPGGSQVCFRAG